MHGKYLGGQFRRYCRVTANCSMQASFGNLRSFCWARFSFRPVGHFVSSMTNSERPGPVHQNKVNTSKKNPIFEYHEVGNRKTRRCSPTYRQTTPDLIRDALPASCPRKTPLRRGPSYIRRCLCRSHRALRTKIPSIMDDKSSSERQFSSADEKRPG